MSQLGHVLDDARIARRIWRSACGRVQVMCPAYLRGTMTAGPDVVRGSGPNQSPGVCTENLIRVDAVMESPKLAE